MQLYSHCRYAGQHLDRHINSNILQYGIPLFAYAQFAVPFLSLSTPVVNVLVPSLKVATPSEIKWQNQTSILFILAEFGTFPKTMSW